MQFAFISNRDHESKSRAFSQFAFNGDVSAEQARQIAADGKSQPCTAILTRGGVISLLKFLEDARQGFRADANAGIGDGDAQIIPILFCREDDFSCVCKFGGIAQQIENNLPDLVLIGINDVEALIYLLFKNHSGFEKRLSGIGAQIDESADSDLIENNLPDLVLIGINDVEALIYLLFKNHSGFEKRLSGIGAQIDESAD